MIESLKRLPVITAVLSLVAAACDEAPSTREVHMATLGTIGFLRTAAGQPPGIPVFVDADPFGAADRLASRFVEALHKASRQYQGLHFSPAGQSEGVAVDRILVVFDVPKGVSGLTLCKGEIVGGQPEGDRLTFRAIVCRGSERLAEAEGRMRGRPASPDDQTLRELFEGAARILIQEEDRTPR